MQSPIDRVFLSLARSFEFKSDLHIELSDEDIKADLDFGRGTKTVLRERPTRPAAKVLS